MTIMDRLRALGVWIRAKIQAARSRRGEQGPQGRDKALAKLGGYLLSPLTETEYVVLKRVSGVMLTAVIVYIVFSAGIGPALVAIDLGVLLLFWLYKVATRAQERDQQPEQS